MKLIVKNMQGGEAGEFEVNFPLIESGKGTQAVHDAVVAHLANRRMGTACTKTMGEVAGTGKKPWRQKGTGRARAGSFQSPLWRGGGVVFGPKPRDLSKRVSKATKTLALRKALSELSLKTKSPSPEEVQTAVASHGVKVRQLDYADILYGMQSDLSVYRGYGLKGTPSVVVTNSKSKKTKIFVGDREITREAIINAIAEVGR